MNGPSSVFRTSTGVQSGRILIVQTQPNKPGTGLAVYLNGEVVIDSAISLNFVGDLSVTVDGPGNVTISAPEVVVDMHSADAAPYTLEPGNVCYMHSEIGAQVGTLPALSAAAGGLPIDIMDVGDNAAVNNGTINAAGEDLIWDFATSEASKTLTLSNGVWRFVPVAAETPYWRVFSL